MKELDWEHQYQGLNINGRKLFNLRFADDILIFAKSTDELQFQLNDLHERKKEVKQEA